MAPRRAGIANLRGPELMIGPQFGQQPLVSRRELERAQLARVDPPEISATQTLRFAADPFAAIEVQAHGLLRISMHETLDQRAYGDGDTEFLMKFSQ